MGLSRGCGQSGDWHNTTREELSNVMRIIITNDRGEKKEGKKSHD